MALEVLVTSERVNALIGWMMIGILALGAAESFRSNVLLWGGFTCLIIAVALLPVLATRDWIAVVPWPLLSVAAIAICARAATVYSEAAGYLAIATFSILVVIELDVFTPIELGRRFAVGFGVLMTMAIEALWIIAQFYSDQWLGTQYLTSQTELQKDIVIVTIAGFAVGSLFYWYFDRFDSVGAMNQSPDRRRLQ